jgi:hypothetical protein
MVLSLNYGDLSGAVSETKRLADELGQYCDDLSRKVQQKMYAVEGGMSSALNSSDYYVNAKIRQLRTRESNARNLSTKTQTLLDTAKRVDVDVERTIKAEQERLFRNNPDLRPDGWKLKVVAFFCDLKNVPILGDLIKGGETVLGAMDQLCKDIKYWYKCEGGKELVGIVLSVVGAVLAVVILVCAFVFTGGTILAVIVGVAGIIGAMIGLVNAVTNIVTSFQAYNEAQGGHPGRAKIYAEQDKLSDVLRQTNFHDKDWNRGSNAWATGIEITDAVCSVIAVVSGAVKTVQAIRKINIAKTFQAICQPRNALGQFTQGKPSLWNGIKSIALKFTVKDFVLGDLNVKNLSRLSTLSRIDQYKAFGTFAKAAKGIIDNIDKVNEGKQTFTQFLANRMVTGIDTALLNQQVLSTVESKNGEIARKFVDSNFTTTIKAIRVPIDGLGLGKLLTDTEHSGTLSNVLNMKGGLIENITDIVKQIGIWAPPQNKVKAVHISPPKIDVLYDISAPAFSVPTLKLDLKFECIYPYYNVKAA